MLNYFWPVPYEYAKRALDEEWREVKQFHRFTNGSAAVWDISL